MTYLNKSLKNAVFHLGLIESFSYWKATASPVIEVLAGESHATDQIRWWEDLLINGMGEFFYRNDIDFTARRFRQNRFAVQHSVSEPARIALCLSAAC